MAEGTEQQEQMSPEQAVKVLYSASRKSQQPVEGVEPAKAHELCRMAAERIMREIQQEQEAE